MARSRGSVITPRQWRGIVERGTGLFGTRELVAVLEARPARQRTWRRLLDGGLLARFKKRGVSEDLVRAASLYLAELTYRVRTQEPSPGSFEAAVHIATTDHWDAAPRDRGALKRQVHALHHGRAARAFEGASRDPGAPGEPEALKVFSALAEALRQQGRKADWTLLVDLRDVIDPPVLVGLRIAPHTKRHDEIPHKTDPAKSTTLYRAPGDGLRLAVNTYRRARGRTGDDDLAALTSEIAALRSRPT